MPVNPRWAASGTTARRKTSVSSMAWARGATRASANSRTRVTKAACVSERPKFMGSAQVGEGGAQARAGFVQFLGKHARLANDGHEVGVAIPAGHDVHVQVIQHA